MVTTKYYVDDGELAFSLEEEEEFFRLRVIHSTIHEEDVEDFLDTTVEWLSTDPTKGILIDFAGVRSVCPGFTVELLRNYEKIKAQGIYVRFVNVDPSVEPHIDVRNITVVMNIREVGSALSHKAILSAKAILGDLAGNMPDEDLMRKHNLSPKGLQSMYRKLLRKGLISKHVLTKRSAVSERTKKVVQTVDDEDANKPSVNAWEVVKDLEDGITDPELMQKYRLSPKGLASLMSKLRANGLIPENGRVLKRRRRKKVKNN